jgi:hypothetical protein
VGVQKLVELIFICFFYDALLEIFDYFPIFDEVNWLFYGKIFYLYYDVKLDFLKLVLEFTIKDRFKSSKRGDLFDKILF